MLALSVNSQRVFLNHLILSFQVGAVCDWFLVMCTDKRNYYSQQKTTCLYNNEETAGESVSGQSWKHLHVKCCNTYRGHHSRHISVNALSSH